MGSSEVIGSIAEEETMKSEAFQPKKEENVPPLYQSGKYPVIIIVLAVCQFLKGVV